MNYEISDIKQISLLDVLPNYILENKRNNKGNIIFEHCPFCNHKWHFQISEDGKLYNSFSCCCVGGDVISFIQETENISFQAAIKRLGDLHSIRKPNQDRIKNIQDKKFLIKFREEEDRRIKDEEERFLAYIKFIGSDEMIITALKYENNLIQYIYYCREVGLYE